MSVIRQAAFGGNQRLLKGGLHCHTTRSDGQMPPQDVIALHIANGYDFLAITDHRVYNFENAAHDDRLLIIPGMEMDRQIDHSNGNTDMGMCFHTVCIGFEKEQGNPYFQDQRFESGTVRNQTEYQPLLDKLHADGQMTIYCHPEWSCTPVRSFDQQQGNFAMEIWNSGCVSQMDMDADNGLYWDELLMQGKRLWAVATDDGHLPNQHALGWVRVNADKRVASVLDALQRGAFYASCGPEILDFYVSDGQANVVCSPCARVQFRCGLVPLNNVSSTGATVKQACCKLNDAYPYIRACVVDAQGRKAWTNPIFLHEKQ